jgi:hypothetical protein
LQRVALFDWNGVVLSVRKRDFKEHGPTLTFCHGCLDRVRGLTAKKSPPRWDDVQSGMRIAFDNRITVVLLDDALEADERMAGLDPEAS